MPGTWREAVRSFTMIPVRAMGDAVPPTAPKMAMTAIRMGFAFIWTARLTAKMTMTDWTEMAPGPAALMT